MTWRLLLILLLAVLLAGIGIGLLIGYHLWHQSPVPSTESVRPAVVQSDGSVQLARVPVAEPGPAPHIIPKGTREERRVRVVVQPQPLSSNPDSLDKDHSEHDLEMVCSCDPIAVDLSLVRHRDGSSGIVASAEGGTVDPAASIDTPILQDEPAAPRIRVDAVVASRDKWSAALMQEYRPFGVPVSVGPAVMRWEGDTVVGLGLSLPLR